MNKSWLLSILIISLFLLSTLKVHQKASLTPFFRGERVIKLESFTEAKSKVSKTELDHLKLWESVLTGRSAQLSKWMRERYKKLGLNHLFTPSGFHISALLFPFMKIIKRNHHQLWLLMLLGLGVSFLPGMTALKRMVLIKIHQKILGKHLGFIGALLLDMMFGSFQEGALSFTYSFLFIGIIYSGLKGFSLIIWFFVAQMLLSLFQGNDISLLLLVFSPLLNFAFAAILPLLFLLTFPLWDWQLHIGLFLIGCLQSLVDFCATLTQLLPTLEVNTGVVLMLGFALYKMRRTFLVLSLLLSFSLNLDRQRTPTLPGQEFIPKGRIISAIYIEKEVRIKFEDGSCRMRLVRGFWWKNCSLRRGSRIRSIMKLSYPSRGSRKSSLRG